MIRQGRAVETPVTLGGRPGRYGGGADGVKAGEQVVVGPPARLRDGSRVSIAEK